MDATTLGVDFPGTASGSMEPHSASAGSKRELGRLLQAVLTSRGQANAVFDILAVLQVSCAGGRGWI